MANKVRIEGLSAQALDSAGEQVAERTAKELARDLVKAAKVMMPAGLPSTSPYAKFTHDQAVNEAARLDMRLSPFMEPAELLLVIENIRLAIVRGDERSPDPAAPPVPMPPPKLLKLRGVKPSPTNTWVVQCPSDKPKSVNVNGHMTLMRNGKIVNSAYYSPVTLQSLIDQGLKLLPIEDLGATED